MREPEQWRRLCAEPALLPTAVEELLRFDGPVQATVRVALEDIEIDEQVIPKGALVLVNLGAAEGHPADVMDMSFADQALAAEWLVNQGDGLSSDVHILPREIDEEVARLKLESMGASLEILTSEQEQYLSSWETGT